MADKFSYMDMPLQIGFQFAGPLDKYVQFDSMADANTWKDGVLGYEGAFVRIKISETEREVATGENDADGNPVVEKKLTTKWGIYKVELVDNVRVFKPAADIEVGEDGKILNTYLKTTVSENIAGALVETTEEGLIDNNLLNNTTEKTDASAGKVVVTNAKGYVDESLIGGVSAVAGEANARKLARISDTGMLDDSLIGGTSKVGGAEHANKVVRISDNGKLDASLIPSVAIGDYLGQYESWEALQAAITAGTIHAPENGDTVEVAEYDSENILLGYSVYICVNDKADGLSNKFATVKSAAGAVTEGAFAGHVNDNIRHITQEEREYWNAKLDSFEVSATGSEGLELVASSDETSATITGTLLVATGTTIGGVKTGDVADTAMSVATDGTISVATASASQRGAVKVGDTLKINSEGVLDAKIVTADKHGIMKAGDYLHLRLDENNQSTGIIDLKLTSKDIFGVVKVGDNINVEGGVISVNVATEDTIGLVKTGNAETTLINVDGEGTISVNKTVLVGELDEKYYILKSGESQNGYTLLSASDKALYDAVVDWYDGGEYVIPYGSKTNAGILQVGNNIDVTTDGIITVAAATKDTLGAVKTGEVATTAISVDANGTLSVAIASKTQRGSVIVGDGLTVTGTGKISLDKTTLVGELDEKYYILKNGEAQEGYHLLSDELLEKINEVNDWYDEGKEIQDASKTQKGVVQIGDNIDVTDGLISVATATKDTLGLVKIGSGLTVENGEVSANILWTKVVGLPTLSDGTDGGNKYYEWTKVCEVKIFDENGGIVFPSEYIVKDGKTRIEFPADFPADGENTTKWTVLVGPAIQ